ncbi:hypothetical protein AV530_010761 [Patagioenas fasciata monilis]|uniref:Uncharacterized protein n=1 Tax=Patagioenas fasciata monilis TaxID=372326 RepID=A0A1V4K970_PATFA|nr:hypothetical protein AV530_010761 [Patagioenas fasciata monilis]
MQQDLHQHSKLQDKLYRKATRARKTELSLVPRGTVSIPKSAKRIAWVEKEDRNTVPSPQSYSLTDANFLITENSYHSQEV